MTAINVTTPPAIEPVTLEEAKLHLRLAAGDILKIDNAAAVDKGGGKVGIPVTGHGLSTDGGEWITPAGTTNYDGSYLTDADTTVNELVIRATYTAETFTGDESIYVNGLENDLIADLITAAREYAENFQHRCYITQTIELVLDEFPDDEIVVPRPPLIAVSSIKYTDTDGNQQTWDNANYTVDNKSHPGRIIPAYTKTWPATRDVPNAVTVTYTAGYGDATTDVPKRVKQAIKLLIGHLYENREATSEKQLASVPMAVEALLWQEKIF